LIFIEYKDSSYQDETEKINKKFKGM
jgi:hypothetical protein